MLQTNDNHVTAIASTDQPKANTPGAAHRPRAGEAFARVLATDPVVKAALDRARERLRKFGKVVAVLGPELMRGSENQARSVVAETRDALRAPNRELESRGFQPPESFEDWEHLARIVGVPFETVRAGDFTLDEVFKQALAHSDRQRIADSWRSMHAPYNAVVDPIVHRSADPLVSLDELAQMFPAMSKEAIRKRLERLRKEDPESFEEVSNPARGRPRYLYKLSKARARLIG